MRPALHGPKFREGRTRCVTSFKWITLFSSLRHQGLMVTVMVLSCVFWLHPSIDLQMDEESLHQPFRWCTPSPLSTIFVLSRRENIFNISSNKEKKKKGNSFLTNSSLQYEEIRNSYLNYSDFFFYIYTYPSYTIYTYHFQGLTQTVLVLQDLFLAQRLDFSLSSVSFKEI